jgi:transposase
VLISCTSVAQRIEFLEPQTDELTTEIDTLATALNPALRAAYRVGPDTAVQLLITADTNSHRLRSQAALAMLSGVAPIPACSGKTTRHRLSRGGDRAANNALHRIALVCWSHDPHTRDYLARQLAAGRTKKDILRLLKRAIAREMFKHLTAPCPIHDYSDLRPTDKPKTSPPLPPPTTSASGPTTSPDSNAASNATTPSPPTTANGSTPSSSTPLNP